MKTNFVLIDLENVLPAHLERLRCLPVEIRIFLGQHQFKLHLGLSGSGRDARAPIRAEYRP